MSQLLKGLEGAGRGWKGLEGAGRGWKGLEGGWKGLEGAGRGWKGLEGLVGVEGGRRGRKVRI